VGGRKTGQKNPKNANDHEQQARVHPAQPSYSVVVPAPELSSIDVAVEGNIGAIGLLRKGVGKAARPAYCGTSLTTGPLTGGDAVTGCVGGSAF
jgi:hypothetical protein